jgi:hypothetical protein
MLDAREEMEIIRLHFVRDEVLARISHHPPLRVHFGAI